jgi:flagellar assembly factor FliW
MTRFESPRFGSVEVADERVVEFPRGLPGFPDCRRFILMDHDRETPLRWLQCVDRPEIAFLVVEPHQVLAAYDIEVPLHVLAFLGWESSDGASDVLLLVLLNASESALAANLRAPLVVHTRTRRATQLILDDPALSFRHPIGGDPAAV